MRGEGFSVSSGVRRLAIAAAVVLGFVAPAAAATPVEQYVSDNVAKGLTILNDSALTVEQRKDRFQSFLTGLCDLKAIAEYTLGQYRRTASPGDLTAFDAAYKDYATAVYQSFFDDYAGQTLKVVGSVSPGEGEYIVKAQLIDPKKPGSPTAVSFRLEQKGGKFTVVDLSAEGVWLRQTQRDDFTAYLGQHGGDMRALTQILKAKTADIKAGKGKKKKK